MKILIGIIMFVLFMVLIGYIAVITAPPPCEFGQPCTDIPRNR